MNISLIWGMRRMAEDVLEQRTCTLRVDLWRYHGAEAWYDAKAGLRCAFGVSGLVEDPLVDWNGHVRQREAASAFHQKQVHLVVRSPPDAKWLEHVGTKSSAANVLGVAEVKARVEPEKIEFDGKWVEAKPVWVEVMVKADAFEALRRQAAEAYDRGRMLQAKVTLVGLPLPNEPFLKLKHLNVEKVSEYAVSGFEMSDTLVTDNWRGRVRRVEPKQDDVNGAKLSILLTSVSYEAEAEHGHFRSISCTGRVIDRRAGSGADPTACQGVSAAIKFAPHDLYASLPESAFFGEFRYSPCREEHSLTYVGIDLRYPLEDAPKFLIPLLDQEAGARVILTIELATGDEELRSATEFLSGNIRHYSFEVSRPLFDYRPIRKQLALARERADRRDQETAAKAKASAGFWRKFPSHPRPGDPDYLKWANREGEYGDEKDLPTRGIREKEFQRLRASVIAGWVVADSVLDQLSWDQIFELERELEW